MNAENMEIESAKGQFLVYQNEDSELALKATVKEYLTVRSEGLHSISERIIGCAFDVSNIIGRRFKALNNLSVFIRVHLWLKEK